MVLPFVEQSAVYDTLRPGQMWEQWIAEYHATDAAGKETMEGVFTQYHTTNPGSIMPGGDAYIAYFKCPSSLLPNIAPATFDLPGHKSVPLAEMIVGYATSDYKGCGGSDGPNFDGKDKNNGVLMKNAESNGPITFSHISDGLSNTLMIAESSYAAGDNDGEGIDDWPTWIGGQYNDEQVRITGEKNSIINLGPFKHTWFFLASGTSKNNVNDDNAYSQHPGGANFGLCDGSVRFISENISQETYNYLHGRDDGKTVGAF